MLEDALRSPAAAPADTARAMISFLQEELPSGAAAAAERLFLRLFPLLLDRVFGPLVPPNYEHPYGGWLSRQNKGGTTTTTSVQQEQEDDDDDNNDSWLSSLSSWVSLYPTKARTTINERDPVAALLGKFLIEIITKEVDQLPGISFSFPFMALPKATQTSWLELIAAATMGSSSRTKSVGKHHADDNDDVVAPLRENALRLFGELVRVPPVEQTQLRAFQATRERKTTVDVKRPLQLSPGYHWNSPPPPAMSPNHPFKATRQTGSPIATPPTPDSSSPMARLSMLEIYLFYFIRYPWACPTSKSQRDSHQFPNYWLWPNDNQANADNWGEKVYEYLFQQYLLFFLPFPKPNQESQHRQRMIGDWELFLRIILEIWMDSRVLVTPIGKAAQTLLKRSHGDSNNGNALMLGLDMSYDLANQVQYQSPPKQVQTCTLLLIKHLVADPSVKAACDHEISSHRDETGLSKPMSGMQLSFYNFVRGSLRHANVHESGSAFYLAIEGWLIWLEPWNVIRSSAGSKQQIFVPHSKPSDRSKYAPQWEPYIFANLHLYTVPLAILLRRCRELDFTPKLFRRSLALVQRVFRVFTPQVVDAIQRGLVSQGLDGKYSHLVQKHEQRLGVHAPTVLGEMSLASCQLDMQCLLEEIHSQHMNSVKGLNLVDRFSTLLRSLPRIGDSFDDEKSLAHLVDQARHIVPLPANYEVFPKVGSATVAADTAGARNILYPPTVHHDVHLTAKCLWTAKVEDRGDPMVRRPVQDYEIGFLVPLTIELSHWLNQKFGIHYSSSSNSNSSSNSSLHTHNGRSKDSSVLEHKLAQEEDDVRKLTFRFNLRFLADYRNMLSIILLLIYGMRKLFY